MAARSSTEQTRRILVEQDRLNLLGAVYRKSPDAVERVLRRHRGADLCAVVNWHTAVDPYERDETALLACAKLLLAPANSHATPHLLRIAGLLVDAGADLDVDDGTSDERDETPLMYALRSESPQLALLLIRAGGHAQCGWHCRWHSSRKLALPGEPTCWLSILAVVTLTKPEKFAAAVAETLLQVSPSSATEICGALQGISILHLAAGAPASLARNCAGRFMSEHYNTWDPTGVPNPRLCQLLLAHGADANTRDPQGRTPLHYAMAVAVCSAYHREAAISVCAGMFRSGAVHTVADAQGRTPAAYALSIADEIAVTFRSFARTLPETFRRIADRIRMQALKRRLAPVVLRFQQQQYG